MLEYWYMYTYFVLTKGISLANQTLSYSKPIKDRFKSIFNISLLLRKKKSEEMGRNYSGILCTNLNGILPNKQSQRLNSRPGNEFKSYTLTQH